jgi:S1-C subfamily serine protease
MTTGFPHYPYSAMNIQFNCPQCGLAIQASTDIAAGTACCPECGQEFVVEASPPVMPVVKAQVVPAPAESAATPVPLPPRTRPPLARPTPASSPHPPARPRYDVSSSASDASKDKLRFIGLAVAGGLLLIAVIWLSVQIGQPENPSPSVSETSAAEIAKQEEAAAEKARLNDELKKIKDSLAAKEQRERELAQEEMRKETAVEEAKLARKQAEYKAVLNYYAVNYFSGDIKAAEAFVKARESVLYSLVDWLREAAASKVPKTEQDGEEYVIQHLITQFERNPVLNQWIKDHNRDPQKFIAELLQKNPKRPGSTSAPNTFDFAKYNSMGSGFLVSSDGWILTNEHVVSDAKVVDLRLHDGKMLQAKVVKTDDANDLALIKADLTAEAWLAVSKGVTDLPKGRSVFTVGYPDPKVQGLEPKFTDGRISAASGIEDRKDSYQTTVPVQHGNSGGALVDFATGWVIGVVNARLEDRTGRADNVSYAIKGKVVSAFFESVPDARTAAVKTPPKPLAKGDEGAVIDRATDSAVLILRQR